jgi:hypothetical protein
MPNTQDILFRTLADPTRRAILGTGERMFENAR